MSSPLIFIRNYTPADSFSLFLVLLASVFFNLNYWGYRWWGIPTFDPWFHLLLLTNILLLVNSFYATRKLKIIAFIFLVFFGGFFFTKRFIIEPDHAYKFKQQVDKEAAIFFSKALEKDRLRKEEEQKSKN